MELSPRKEKILSSVVRGYVEHGEPVGSKRVAEEIGVSSATVRSEMAELIALGLLEQPHTSAGRVPSERGYREYVDRLMDVPALSEGERRSMESALLAAAFGREELLRRAGELLAERSRIASLVTVPSGAGAAVKAVQLVQTGRRTAMLLLMSSAGTLKSRMFRCDFDLTGEMLRVFFRVFNEKIAGQEVRALTPAFLQTVAVSLGELVPLIGPAMEALLGAARDTLHTAVLCSGQMNLLFYAELDHGPLMRFLEREDAVAALLAQRPGRVVSLIGGESGYEELRDASVLVSRYTVAGENAGALALVGPMRLDYPGLTAVLRYLTEEVSVLLTGLAREE